MYIERVSLVVRMVLGRESPEGRTNESMSAVGRFPLGKWELAEKFE